MSKITKLPHTCSICKGTYTDLGNNAWPFAGRCCDNCNDKAVIPVRIIMNELQRKLKQAELCK